MRPDDICPHPRFWRTWQLELLRQWYPRVPTQALADALRMRARAVYAKAEALGLRKSEDFFASDLSGRVQRCKQDPRMRATQFRAGMTPWNKGRHFEPGGRSIETRFKPGVLAGRAAQLVQPIGAYRINGDGYLNRKVCDTPGPQHTRWKAVHRLVWEAAHGAVPPGHAVAFLPGRRTTDPECITLDALDAGVGAKNLPPGILGTTMHRIKG